MFDLDDYRKAHAPWCFTHQGRAFVARPVSADQAEAFLSADLAVSALGAGATARRTAARARQRLLRQMFPWRLSYLWRGDPVPTILALEPPAQRELLLDFFEFLGVIKRASSAPATDGTI